MARAVLLSCGGRLQVGYKSWDASICLSFQNVRFIIKNVIVQSLAERGYGKKSYCYGGMEMEALKLMKCRKSVRSYTGTLKEEQLKAVLNAGQAAPVGMGKYETMHLTVIRDKEFLHEIDRNAAEFMGDPSRTPLYGAPCLILISTQIPDPTVSNVPHSNAAIMAEHMALSAVDMGLGSCLIWGAVAALNTKPELVAKLGLPEGHTACCGVVIGETNEVLSEREIDETRVSVSYYGS